MTSCTSTDQTCASFARDVFRRVAEHFRPQDWSANFQKRIDEAQSAGYLAGNIDRQNAESKAQQELGRKLPAPPPPPPALDASFLKSALSFRRGLYDGFVASLQRQPPTFATSLPGAFTFSARSPAAPKGSRTACSAGDWVDALWELAAVRDDFDQQLNLFLSRKLSTVGSKESSAWCQAWPAGECSRHVPCSEMRRSVLQVLTRQSAQCDYAAPKKVISSVNQWSQLPTVSYEQQVEKQLLSLKTRSTPVTPKALPPSECDRATFGRAMFANAFAKLQQWWQPQEALLSGIQSPPAPVKQFAEERLLDLRLMRDILGESPQDALVDFDQPSVVAQLLIWLLEVHHEAERFMTLTLPTLLLPLAAQAQKRRDQASRFMFIV